MTDDEKTPAAQPLDYASPTPATPASRVKKILMIALGLFGIFALAGLLLPDPTYSRETANLVKCGSNLRQIGQAMQLYANDHGGHYPDTVDGLLEEDITSAVFVCPSSNDSPAIGPTTQAVAANLTAGGHLSYVYLGKGLTSASPATQILAYEPAGHHPGGSNFLFCDGHVDFLSVAQAAKVVAEINAGHNPPRAEKLK